MAAHSACAISGGAVTVRRAPPARLRPAGSLARPNVARHRARPRRASPAPTSALASLARPRWARLAAHPPVRAPRRAGTREDERL
jgi:hypothetical protein